MGQNVPFSLKSFDLGMLALIFYEFYSFMDKASRVQRKEVAAIP